MCTTPNTGNSATSVIERLERATSAEEFFCILGVPYDPKLLNVARLHILKRMGQYLASEDLAGLSNEAVTARCQAVLERAYQDFVGSSPLEQRVFKVLKDAVSPQRGAFVPLDALK